MRRAFHWIGIGLALPILLANALAFVWWLHGAFPPTVTAETVILVTAMACGLALAVYLICRAIGWIASLSGATHR